jgi:hypothetical protein
MPGSPNASANSGPLFSGPFPEAARKFNSLIQELTETIGHHRSILVENELTLRQQEAILAGLYYQSRERDQEESLELLVRAYEAYQKLLLQIQREINRVDDRIQVVKKKIREHPQASSPVYESGDEETLRKALLRMGLLKKGQQVPEPAKRLSGVAGKSRVYPIFIPKGDGEGLNLIAKFDPSERAQQEWKKLEEIRSSELPPGVLLPLNIDEVERDKVIIYRAVQSYAESGKVEDLKTYLRIRLVSNTKNCVGCLSGALKVLRGFHDRGKFEFIRRDRKPAKWSHVFDLDELILGAERRQTTANPSSRHAKPDKLSLGKKLQRYATSAWKGIDWTALTIKIKVNGGSRSLPNPVAEAILKEKLSDEIGSARKSRIHGDLNHTNMLICMKRNYDPAEWFVIDLGNTEADQLTAIDFARLESEFWVDAFQNCVFESGSWDDLMSGLILVRDWLDGRNPDKQFSKTAEPVQAAACTFVRTLRRHTKSLLSGVQNPSCLEDFFHCLYFTSLASLRFKGIQAEPVRVRVLLLGAALSLQTLTDVKQGMYGGKQPRYRFPF